MARDLQTPGPEAKGRAAMDSWASLPPKEEATGSHKVQETKVKKNQDASIYGHIPTTFAEMTNLKKSVVLPS